MVAAGADEPLPRPPALVSGPEPAAAARAPGAPAGARPGEAGGAGVPPGSTTLVELEVAGRVIARARIVRL
jgi:hypothetical protein